MTTNLSPSFYKIIRDYRHDDQVSDDQFIASLVAAVERGKVERQECGHGVDHISDGVCRICETKRLFYEDNID
jgi:hypothetical protein